MDPSVFHAPSGCWGREKGEREGTTNPLVLFSVKTPYLAEKICESDRQIREKKFDESSNRLFTFSFSGKEEYRR